MHLIESTRKISLLHVFIRFTAVLLLSIQSTAEPTPLVVELNVRRSVLCFVVDLNFCRSVFRARPDLHPPPGPLRRNPVIRCGSCSSNRAHLLLSEANMHECRGVGICSGRQDFLCLDEYRGREKGKMTGLPLVLCVLNVGGPTSPWIFPYVPVVATQQE